MAIDYDKEYDTRGRVPDAADILGRMAKDAATYRTQAVANKRAELDVRYGETPREIVDIFFSEAGPDAPLAIFIHGGYWRALQPSAFSQVAAGLNAHGVTVALPGYNLCPQVGIGDIVEEMRRAALYLHKRFDKCLLVLGHSAGGHLTGALFATDWAKLGAPADLVYDTDQEVGQEVPAILAAATGDAPRMPPAGGVTADERDELAIWLRCFPPSPGP